MIRVVPEKQAREDSIAVVNLAVEVSALLRLVIVGESAEAVWQLFVSHIGRYLRVEA